METLLDILKRAGGWNPGLYLKIENAPYMTLVIEATDESGPKRTSDRVITDPDQLRRLVAFANARRQCSTPTTYTMPAPQTNAIFYGYSNFIGSIGAGPNFFIVSLPTQNRPTYSFSDGTRRF
jgi:hypothetical protein